MIANRLQNIATFEKAMRHPKPTRANDRLSLFTRRTSIFIFMGLLTLGTAACNKSEDKSALQNNRETLSVAESPLAKAAIEGDLDEIKALLERGADINAKDPLGRTPLHMAAFYGRTKTSEFLIAKGAEINAKDRVGMTALHVAVISGGRQEVEVLLDNKADIKAASDSGKTALHLAAATGQPKLSKFLIDRGADPQVKDSEGKTPLSYATQNKHPQTIALLQKYTTND
ncbi:MAG: ankyrin repeat domain-containing protein [Betaproteobacteria bacterium]